MNEEELESCLTANIILKNADDIYNVLLTNGRMFDESLYTAYSDVRDNSTELYDYYKYLRKRVEKNEITLDIRNGKKILLETLDDCYDSVYEYISECRGSMDYMSMYDLDDLTREEFDDIHSRNIRGFKYKNREERKESFKKKFIKQYKKPIDNLHEVLYTVYIKRERKY